MNLVIRLVQRSAWLSRLYWSAKYLRTDPYAVGESAQGRYDDALRLIPAEAYGHVLELGCGEGVFTAMLAQRGGRITATDISVTAVRRAATRLGPESRVDLRVHDVMRDPLPREAFSLVVCLELLYYVPGEQLVSVIDSICQSVAPGGYLLLGHRRQRPQTTGWFTIPFGCETIHEQVGRQPSLRCAEERQRPGDVLSLFARTSGELASDVLGTE